MNRRELFKGLGATMAAVAVAATVEDKPNRIPRPEGKRIVRLPSPDVAQDMVVTVKNLSQHETVVVVSDGQAWHQV